MWKLLGFLWAAITVTLVLSAVAVLILGFISWGFCRIFSKDSGDEENYEEDS